MNREIKFRAWDKKNKTMLGRQWPMMEINSDGTFGFPEDELCQIMQFTGLKDKNGVEIYEGDVLECKETEYDSKYLVEDEMSNNCGECGYVWGWEMPESREDIEKYYEVIGNIYEHSHLLDGK